MPLQRRLPKFGFKPLNRTEYKAVNLVDLERLAETAGIEKIGVAELVAAGLINGKQPVKILATGRLTRKLAVEANAFSAAAEKAIVEAGGSVTKI